MGELQLLQSYLVVGAMLFSIGLLGVLTRRNMIVMFLAVEMMLQGVSVSLVAWSRFHNDWGGQILVIFVLTVAACEAAIALVLVLMLFHTSGRPGYRRPGATCAKANQSRLSSIEKLPAGRSRGAPVARACSQAGVEPTAQSPQDRRRGNWCIAAMC